MHRKKKPAASANSLAGQAQEHAAQRSTRALLAENGIYQARPIKRHRSTQADLATLDGQLVTALELDYPQSVRHLFYLMTNPRLAVPVPKTDAGYALVQRRCVLLRERGAVAYDRIADATRRGYFVNTYSNAADFIRNQARFYRADLWREADYRCEVWVESRSLAGVVLDVCEDLGVSLYPAAGFASLSFIYAAAEIINAADDGRPLIVFYIGDYDPAGVLIDRAIEEGLRKHLRLGVDMQFIRLGITPEQVASYDLPTKPRKDGDRRAREVAYTVEAEAMPAHTLRELLRASVESLLPAHAIRAAAIEEAQQRHYLHVMATRYEQGEV